MSTEDKIQEIYALIPDTECRGLCVEACGPLIVSRVETARIVVRHGSAPVGTGPNMSCNKLVEGKCSIYADRPLVCRMFGAVGGMKCPFGCKPKEGRMADMIARRLLNKMHSL